MQVLKKKKSGIPILTRWRQIWLVTMRMWVCSLALLSGLSIWHCCELWCKLQTWLGSCVAMAVWLWHRPAPVAPIWPLVWERSCATGYKQKKKKISADMEWFPGYVVRWKKKKKKKKAACKSVQSILFFFFSHGCMQGLWKFPCQGLNPNWSCDLCHSCSNLDPLTHWSQLGIKPVLLQLPKVLQSDS